MEILDSKDLKETKEKLEILDRKDLKETLVILDCRGQWACQVMSE